MFSYIQVKYILFFLIRKMFRLVRRCLLIIVQTNQHRVIYKQIEAIGFFSLNRNQTKLTRMETAFSYTEKELFIYKRNVIYFNNGFEISNYV